jgi:hypothetical protein
LSSRDLGFLRRWGWGDGWVVVVVVFQEVGGRVDVKENVYDDVLFDDSTSIKLPGVIILVEVYYPCQ